MLDAEATLPHDVSIATEHRKGNSSMQLLTTAAGRTPPRYARGGRHCALQTNLGQQSVRRSLSDGAADARNHKLACHSSEKSTHFLWSRVHRIFNRLGTGSIHANRNGTQTSHARLVRGCEVIPELDKLNRVHEQVLAYAECMSIHLLYRFGTPLNAKSVLFR